jgi:hypothetical protein
MPLPADKAVDERGVFTSTVALQAVINRFIAETNEQPKAFVWTKPADAISPSCSAGGKRTATRI